MFGYYTAISLLSWLSLGILGLLVHENARIQPRNKRLLYLTYALIALSALAEYCGVQFGSMENLSRRAIVFVKTVDYIVTPMAGGAIILQMGLKNRWNWIMAGLLGFNTLLQLVSIMGGWMVRVSENNQYSHGPLYPLYLGLCMAIIFVVALQFIFYGRSFNKQNRKSLFSIMILIVAGIILQELSGGQVRTAYLSLTLGVALIFIHNVEFASQEMDDNLRRQQLQLDTDALTGVYSRHAYSLALEALDTEKTLPAGFAAFSIDVNGLKQINDRLGHEAGDELIRGAAECIMTALCKKGRCYRTGGDEFIVLTYMDREEADNAIKCLQQEAERWHGNTLKTISLAAGFALAEEHEGLSAEKLVGEADKAMYQAKAVHYRLAGVDRRKRS